MRTQIRPVVAACVMWAATAAPAADSGPEVAVSGGKIQGSLASYGGPVFQGVLSAQPPTGELRWREPLPVKTWAGVRAATAFGAPCMQGGSGKSSEDCLYLNIWTPEWPAKSRQAVIVWFHGGGNFAGAATDPLFDGESLAGHGVVVVTAQYRLGVFGFFAHPDLTKKSPHHVSGNYGLLGQIAALRWVRDNIAKVGGDPGNVTIFGESARSLDINVLMASPLSRGLYHRVIGQSGPVVAPPPLAEAEKKGEDLALKLTMASLPGLKGMRALSSVDLQVRFDRSAGVGRDRDVLDQFCEDGRSQRWRPAAMAEVRPFGRAYLEFTDAGPAARKGLRRQVCDLYTENLKRQMAK